MARIKMGLRSEAPIAPKLHKRPRRRRAEQARIEWVERVQGEGDICIMYIYVYITIRKAALTWF